MHLFDGGGHRIHEGMDARDFAGGFDIHHTQTRLSGWVPMVAAILGPGFGQPTISASLCDYVVAVRSIATVGMAPPALVAAATGEVPPDDLNSPDVQAGFGTIDDVVDTEVEAIAALRWYLDLLPSNAEAPLPIEVSAEPAVAPEVLDTLVPADLRRGYDMRQVVAGLVDEDSEVELKAGHAPNLITTLARVEGRPMGIVASQPLALAGTLDAAAAAKAAHLVSLCDAFGIPLLVLMDLPGLAVGTEAERAGLARAGARLSLELGRATVPTFTVVVRKGYGGGYVILSGGRSFDPELVVAWPHAETAVMSAENAVDLVHRREVREADDPAALRSELIEGYRGRVGAIRGAEAFGFDAVIRPSETRAWLAELLAILPRHRHRLQQTSTPRAHPSRRSDPTCEGTIVIVIGGGAAGAAAAFRLRSQGHEVVLLEATEEIGGRTRTLWRDGFGVEFGAIYLLNSYERCLALLEEAGRSDVLAPWSPAAGLWDGEQLHELRYDYILRSSGSDYSRRATSCASLSALPASSSRQRRRRSNLTAWPVSTTARTWRPGRGVCSATSSLSASCGR